MRETAGLPAVIFCPSPAMRPQLPGVNTVMLNAGHWLT